MGGEIYELQDGPPMIIWFVNPLSMIIYVVMSLLTASNWSTTAYSLAEPTWCEDKGTIWKWIARQMCGGGVQRGLTNFLTGAKRREWMGCWGVAGMIIDS